MDGYQDLRKMLSSLAGPQRISSLVVYHMETWMRSPLFRVGAWWVFSL